MDKEQSQVEASPYKGKICKKTATCIVILSLICALALFQWCQVDFAESCIQGYWLISDGIFLLIDDNVVKVVNVDKKTIIFEDTNSKICYNSILATKLHKFSITRSKCSIKNNANDDELDRHIRGIFKSDQLLLEVTPALAICKITDPTSELSLLCYKEPQMTYEYFTI